MGRTTRVGTTVGGVVLVDARGCWRVVPEVHVLADGTVRHPGEVWRTLPFAPTRYTDDSRRLVYRASTPAIGKRSERFRKRLHLPAGWNPPPSPKRVYEA